jgi:glycosyltransferase involved in cell wall biosynthesis
LKEPIISIIIPTFNSSGSLSECLESIVKQSFQNFEILLIDGLSTDNTLDIISTFMAKYNSIKFISEKDQGIYDAMNKGIS